MSFEDNLGSEGLEIGSDELLSDDNLRLPESANVLVRVHAVRSWLMRRQKETELELGEAALALRDAQQESTIDTTRLRRREQQRVMEHIQKVQKDYQDMQKRLNAFEEAAALLEDYIAHTTSNERALVEYYLALEDMVQQAVQTEMEEERIRIRVLMEVQNRVERMTALHEDEEG